MTLTVASLLRRKRDAFSLSVLVGERGLEREIRVPEVSSPGLALAGYSERFVSNRVQIFGQTEIAYLASLSDAERGAALTFVFQSGVPCAFITKSQDAPEQLLVAAEAAGVTLLSTPLKTGDFYRRLQPYLEEEFAPRTSIHGSLADVYGIGLLFMGPSGIGKSECVLDLVERGHRLVADDLILVHRRQSDILLGRAHEHQRHHMEMRGVGIIDIRAMFGIRAVREQKRIEVVVELEVWGARDDYDRTGLETEECEILGVPLPKVRIPLNPGKNITVIAEVIAMNHLLRFSGEDPAAAFERDLIERMRPVRDYLESDDE
ncbi:HPr(Ser) kinase/phosphatase [Candidatus Palauibacter sp.]|uniref:HPr(Ser) kinase/phosphatase n=1 Tax=Candidatus Palauibacter sp. TaxID=3101350 RepID=UPI003AF28DA6